MALVHYTLSHWTLEVYEPNSFVQLKEQIKICIYLCYKGGNLKNKHARVMVLVHDTSSECAFQKYEVSLKYLWGLYSRQEMALKKIKGK